MDPYLMLTYVAVILMLGILCTVAASVLKIPKTLLLILLGLTLGEISFNGVKLIEFNAEFITGLATLAFILVVFDSASRLKAREESEHPRMVLKFIRVFMIFSIICLTLFTLAIFFNSFSFTNIILALIFSVLVVETDIGSVFQMVKQFARERTGRILLFLETEADLNSAFIIIFPFVLMTLMSHIKVGAGEIYAQLWSALPAFLSQILVAIGVGLVVGIVLLKSIRNRYSEHFTPITVFSAALLSFLLARFLKAEGVVAVATLGFLFGNSYVRGKEQLEEFSSMLSKSLEIIVYVTLGIIISIPFTADFIGKSLLLFVVLIGVRALAVFTTLHDEHFRKDEKIFISLNMPKGMDLAAVALLLSIYSFKGLEIILPLIVSFIIYSLILSFLADMYHHKILQLKREPLESHHVPVPTKKSSRKRSQPI